MLRTGELDSLTIHKCHRGTALVCIQLRMFTPIRPSLGLHIISTYYLALSRRSWWVFQLIYEAWKSFWGNVSLYFLWGYALLYLNFRRNLGESARIYIRINLDCTPINENISHLISINFLCNVFRLLFTPYPSLRASEYLATKFRHYLSERMLSYQISSKPAIKL